MKFEIFKFKKLTSTNDKAMDLIKNKKKNQDLFLQKIKLTVEVLKEKNGYQWRVIFLDHYFLS